MSNNAPDYENNLAFDPDINTMPRCDIEELKGQIEQLKALNTADDYLIKMLEEKNKQLKELLSKARNSVQFDYYEAIGGGADYQAKFLKDLLTAIDNAIGEKN